MIARWRNLLSSSALALVTVTALPLSLAGEKKASAILPDTDTTNKGYLTFFFDNDLFSGTDGNYTNGGRISFITEGKPIINIPIIQKNLHRLSGDSESLQWAKKIWGFQNAHEVERSYGFALTQLMFTPETRESLTPPPGERPYAGWLGIGLSLHARDSRTLNSVEISFGVVGPHSFAKETQDFVHNIRDIDKFKGWDSQIPEEVTLNVSFNQRRRWTDLKKIKLPLGFELDGFHESGYSLGNYFTAAHIGFMVRGGWNLPVEFSDPRLTPTAHTQKLYTNGENEATWSLYALAGARAGGILHDITLDGPVFRSYDSSVDKEPWVGELYAGFGIRYQDWEFGYVHTYRSKRFKTQKRNQSFGSIAIRTRF